MAEVIDHVRSAARDEARAYGQGEARPLRGYVLVMAVFGALVARLAELGIVQTRVDRVEDGQLHLALVELDRNPEPGTDSALLAAGHPTLTAIDSVSEADSHWLASALRRIA